MVSTKLIKFLDKYFGVIICFILSLWNVYSKVSTKKSNNEYRNVLLIQLWGIGETILALPAIKALKERNKNLSVDILVTDRVEEIFFDNKNLNNVKGIELNLFSIAKFIIKNYKKYELAIDMEEYLNISAIIAFFTAKESIGYSHGRRSNLYTKKVDYNDRQHTTQTFMDLLRPLGIKKGVKSLERLSYSNSDKNNVDSLLKENNIARKSFIVGFGIGAAESVRERIWPEERFASLADYLTDNYNAKIILFGNKDERNLADNIIGMTDNKSKVLNFAGKTSLREMFYLTTLCKLFIGNDAGPMHVAAAQGVTTIGLFGCNLPVRFKPFGKRGFYIYKKESQEACINVHKGEVGKCKFGKENACVRKIHVGDVIKIVDKVIKVNHNEKIFE